MKTLLKKAYFDFSFSSSGQDEPGSEDPMDNEGGDARDGEIESSPAEEASGGEEASSGGMFRPKQVAKGALIGGGGAAAALGAKSLWDKYQKHKRRSDLRAPQVRIERGHRKVSGLRESASEIKGIVSNLAEGGKGMNRGMEYLERGNRQERAEEALRHGNVDRAKDLLGIEEELEAPGSPSRRNLQKEIDSMKDTANLGAGAVGGAGAVLGAKKLYDKYRRQKARRPMPSKQTEDEEATRHDQYSPERGHFDTSEGEYP